ncbi:peptide chain release factor-like protein [Kiloniella sp.]|uniref:peptide chain release factor-like protein n=1 Tax=Kiloniella sp. TaxID=1938587 RepID=UPI003B026E93
MHTSTVTVAVLSSDQKGFGSGILTVWADDKFKVDWFSGTGKGGQHRNKTQNCCRIKHLETGFTEARQGRKREDNFRQARDALLVTLEAYEASKRAGVEAHNRKSQIGSGMRGDKSVTLRFQDDVAINHSTGRKMSLKKYMRGEMDRLWA